jgi:hypothetical protein
MLAPACAIHIPLANVPAHVIVRRGGQRVIPPPRSSGGSSSTTTTTTTATATTTTSTAATPPPPSSFLEVGDEVFVKPRAHFTLSYAGNSFHILHGHFRLLCRNLALGSGHAGAKTSVLAIALQAGRVQVSSGTDPQRALVLTREILAFATARGTDFVVGRDPADSSSRTWTMNTPIVAAKAGDPALRINTRITYTAISDRRGQRLDIWPFSLSPLQRPATAGDALPAFWADGRPCSVGCTAPGAVPGWPLQPFDQQHAIRAGINELRPANFHVAVDIQAQNFQPVYAIQSGYASIRYPGTGDVNVDVGSFYYWHINPAVSNGQYVTAYKTVIGQVLNGFYHVALSEGNTNDYLNPLRPGGSLRPYTDTEAPVIGIPRIFSDGRVIVAAFDPQSFVATGFPYETPVLAPSSLGWRLYDSHGRALTGLEWAMRGSQNYPASDKPVIFAPGASNPGFECFFTQRRCIPNWVYWLAGGLTQPLPLRSLRAGQYRLTVYAWDWAGNTSALDYAFKLPLVHAARASSPEFGPLNAQFEYDETGAH